MPHLIRDDRARLAYEHRRGTRLGTDAFIFQHGMGGDRQQPLGYVRTASPSDLYAMDARGHGASSDVVPDRATFDAYADDVIALADHLGLDRFLIGGISLGAAVSLNLAIRYPTRITGLLLCRPAWLETAQGHLNRQAYDAIADLLDTTDTDDALARYTRTDIYTQVEAESVNAAQSLRHQITRPRATINADILRRFPSHSPAPQLADWSAITVPTTVIAHRDDPFHSWTIAEQTSARIPDAELIEITSKDRDSDRFAAEVDTAIRTFLTGKTNQ